MGGCVCDLPVHPGLTAANGSLGLLMLVSITRKVAVCGRDFSSLLLSQSSVCLGV